MNIDCLFCKIIIGEVPSEKIYEDERVFAFLDIHPINPGHTLIVPKQHVHNLLEADDQTLGALITTTKKLGLATQAALDYSGFNVGINTGSAAGQVIFHLHIHIMPRRENDGYTLWSGQEYFEGQAQEVAKKIRDKLGVA